VASCFKLPHIRLSHWWFQVWVITFKNPSQLWRVWAIISSWRTFYNSTRKPSFFYPSTVGSCNLSPPILGITFVHCRIWQMRWLGPAMRPGGCRFHRRISMFGCGKAQFCPVLLINLHHDYQWLSMFIMSCFTEWTKVSFTRAIATLLATRQAMCGSIGSALTCSRISGD
jgi:hypothetical protein